MAKSTKEELKYLEGKLKQNPDSILFARLADLYLSMNNIDEAIKFCENGIKKYPYYVTGHYIISRCYLQKKQFDHAEKELKRVLLFDSQYIAAHRDYGDLMAQIGWNSTCEESYEKILEIDPFNTKARRHIDELKNKFQLHDDIKEEFDDELGEFEEEAIVTKEAVDVTESKEAEEETIEEFEEVFSEKSKQVKTITEDEEEKFSYILDDIFRNDGVSTTADEEKNESIEDQSQFSLEEIDQEDKSDSSSLEDEEFSGQDFEKWLDSSEEPEATENIFEETMLHDENNSDNITKDVDETLPSVEEPAVHNDIEEWLETSVEPEPIQSKETDIGETQQPVKQKPTGKKEKIVTPTLGEIYTAQHQYAKAIGVYEILKKNDPDNPIYQQKIEHLKKKLEESQNLEN